MDSYRTFLAENILSGGEVITYRFLSRALKVHVNLAKQMLYDFYTSQKDKQPGAVYATYLLYGTKQLDKEKTSVGAQVGEDDDVEMTSSMPEVEESAEAVPTFTLSLVPDEQLQAVLATYDEISSIHIYSLGPHPMKDMALLSDAALKIHSLPRDLSSSDNPKAYGTISNPYVRRRERRVDDSISTTPKSSNPFNVRPTESKTTAKAPTAPPKSKEEHKASQPAQSQDAPTVPAKKTVPTLKRGGSAGSGIMQSFAKAAAAAKTKKTESSPLVTSSTGDSSAQPMSDGEEDDSHLLPGPRTQDGPARKNRKEREEELRRMMEEEDGDAETEERAESPDDEPMEEEPEPEEPEPEEEPPSQDAVKEEPSEVVSASANGRRRGRRKVMKKEQILDEQGYLVTIQQPGWESFSEDEAPPPSSKPKPSSSDPAAKAKKGTPKGSQGNIMSFFSKK